VFSSVRSASRITDRTIMQSRSCSMSKSRSTLSNLDYCSKCSLERDSGAYCSRTARSTSVWRRSEADRPPDASGPGCGQLTDTRSQVDPICEAMVDPGPHEAPSRILYIHSDRLRSGPPVIQSKPHGNEFVERYVPDSNSADKSASIRR
jgi:hypothetical protein